MHYLRFLVIGILSVMLVGCSSPTKGVTAVNNTTAEVIVSTPDQADEAFNQLSLDSEQLLKELPSDADFDGIPTDE